MSDMRETYKDIYAEIVDEQQQGYLQECESRARSAHLEAAGYAAIGSFVLVGGGIAEISGAITGHQFGIASAISAAMTTYQIGITKWTAFNWQRSARRNARPWSQDLLDKQ